MLSITQSSSQLCVIHFISGHSSTTCVAVCFSYLHSHSGDGFSLHLWSIYSVLSCFTRNLLNTDRTLLGGSLPPELVPLDFRISLVCQRCRIRRSISHSRRNYLKLIFGQVSKQAFKILTICYYQYWRHYDVLGVYYSNSNCFIFVLVIYIYIST